MLRENFVSMTRDLRDGTRANVKMRQTTARQAANNQRLLDTVSGGQARATVRDHRTPREG